ncbi:hypothetical protein CP965_12945 [Halarcobacter mediterraneus]|uniref:Uncharacterized protein n=1 Tax=Halarcobacter mediterraneus TaxID=2023153 RepID=A0A4Q1ASS3_9BACT|nr:hypothetical protein [Halarcobacter mediterraneus]RXK11671.1 hypothetical protein CP965_12945 [Halarcobacter mediterraneus]
MNTWLVKNRKEEEILIEELQKELYKNHSIEDKDILYVYTDDNSDELFNIRFKFLITNNGKSIKLDEKEDLNKTIDIPYTLYYKTKKANEVALISEEQLKMVFGEEVSENDKKDIRERFGMYIESLTLGTKKISTRIKYLDEILPIKIDEDNPISIFEISDLNVLDNIRTELSSGGRYYEWDRKGSYSGEILQTLNMYINFLDDKSVENTSVEEESNQENLSGHGNKFKSFLNKINPKEEVKVDSKINNIEFIIGQPNTGKSYKFEEKQIFKTGTNHIDYKYLKVPVSGGIGNEYKGLQNTDLAITIDSIKKEIKFGEFLQFLMSAIVNPKIDHVVFLDDFHNQDISSLLSEYTPLFKSQQKRVVKEVDEGNEIFTEYFDSANDFIKEWNTFMDEHCKDIPIVPITNRISGNSLKLVYPKNFYLLGAANFNEYSLNIFADWEDRANIAYKDPIDTFDKNIEGNDFAICCKELNQHFKDILEENKIFDYEKYCFGQWKIVNSNGDIIDNLREQKETIKFFFGMIKNSLKFNNKNSEINRLGWDLMCRVKNNTWIKENLKELSDIDSSEKNFRLLHKFNIYEDDL